MTRFRGTSLVVVLLLILADRGIAANYYVAPAGDDAAAGTLAEPFATIARAQSAAAPGDTVCLRGGTYVMNVEQIARRKRIWAYVVLLDKSGTPDRPIVYRAYQEERPVFDFSAVRPPGLRVHAFQVSASWIRLEGVEIVGVQVTAKRHTQSVCVANDGSHNVFARLRLHDGQAIGYYSTRGSDNLVLNCDAYRNHDTTSEDHKGGNVDGFGCHPMKGSTGNVFRGCRAWFNSDDGFDCISAHEVVTFENCWAFYNGYSPTFAALANGAGFKAGGYGDLPATRLPNPIPRHVTRFCVAVRNKNNGFYANHHPGGCDWINNTAYRNGADFNMLGRLADNRTDVDGAGHLLRNNVAFGGVRAVIRMDREKCEAISNSFTMTLPIDAADFVSLDESGLVQERQADGSLPESGFLRPAARGRLIDRGTPTGFPFRGQAPDLGAFER